MALQGTIDAFPVVDVLNLLAGSRKTGRLIVEGDRSTAQLFVVDGGVTGGGVQDVGHLEVADVVAELLRYADGSFLFEPGSVAPEPTEPQDLLELVAGAAERLEQWAAIEQAVPSMAHRLSLAAEVDAAGVTIAADEWPLIVAAGAGARVDEAIEAVGRPHLAACALIAEMADRQLVVVAPPSAELVHVAVDVATPAAGSELTDAGRRGDVEDAEVVVAGPVEPASPLVDAPLDDRTPEETSVDDATYEVVLMDDGDDGAFPEHFPIDDLVGAGEEQDPWVLLEAAGKDDRLAAAQSFDGASDPGFTVGAFSTDAFRDPSSGPSSTAPATEPATPRTDPAAWSPDPVGGFSDSGAFTDPVDQRSPTSFGGTSAPSAAFVGDGAFTEEPAGSPLAVQIPDAASDSAADEVLRQMSKLSPKAAEAIAAALGSTGEDTPGT